MASSPVGQVKVQLVFAFIVFCGGGWKLFFVGQKCMLEGLSFSFGLFLHALCLGEPRPGKDFVEPLALLFY